MFAKVKQVLSVSDKAYKAQMNAVKRAASALRLAEQKAEREEQAVRTARILAGKPVTYKL